MDELRTTRKPHVNVTEHKMEMNKTPSLVRAHSAQSTADGSVQGEWCDYEAAEKQRKKLGAYSHKGTRTYKTNHVAPS